MSSYSDYIKKARADAEVKFFGPTEHGRRSTSASFILGILLWSKEVSGWTVKMLPSIIT